MTLPQQSSPLAVVTGGTRGIGRAVADDLLAEGYDVIALARRADQSAAFPVVACDLADRDALADALRRLPPVDVLVNNAGIAASARVESISLADWDHHFAVNTTAPFLCLQAVLPSMRRRGHGRIVTIASTAALAGAPYVAAYAASKHAVLGLTRVVAAELRGTALAAATVCPSYVDTDMTRTTVDRIAAMTGASTSAAHARLLELTPGGRLVQPAEVAAEVRRLLALSAVDMNGLVTVIDGR
jgi:NAD(P)-dependent dehydrogenase (short-subunit alcohol dehydrogenase family)